MKLETSLSKLVKPSSSTPSTLRNFDISFIDEFAPTINVPLILYYPAPPTAENGQLEHIVGRLETSLSEMLTEFYPLAGRFMRSISLVECSDQGVRYVRAKANLRLSDVLVLGLGHDLKPDLLNNFLPCEIGKADEIDDPMLSIKITSFECGGLAIGMCFSHKISDMGTMCTFIDNWATRNREEEVNELQKYSPIFNSTFFFPRKGLPELDMRVPRSSTGVKNAARRILFKGKAIAAMREKLGFTNNEGCTCMPSKVQLVVAMLWKAFIRIDQVNNGQSKASFLVQAVGLRDKLVPRLPDNSFGNFWGLAATRLRPGEGEDLDFQGFFELLRDSIRKTAKGCARILTDGEEGYELAFSQYFQLNRTIGDEDVNVYFFSSWCKFSFYEANFGWGKPIWASTGKFPVQNLVVMMDEQYGDGVEAWVHLDERSMTHLEQDSDLKVYAFY